MSDPKSFIALFRGPVPATVSQTRNSHKLTESSVLLGGRYSLEQVANELRILALGECQWIVVAAADPVKLTRH
jgi:hypothetical protein